MLAPYLINTLILEMAEEAGRGVDLMKLVKELKGKLKMVQKMDFLKKIKRNSKKK